MSTPSRQLLLPTTPRPETLEGQYVPIVLLKRGELTALRHLTARSRAAMTPWVRVLPPELRSARDPESVFDGLKQIHTITPEHCVYLDPAACPRRARHAPALDASYVEACFDAAVDAGLAVAPVHSLERPDLADVTRIAARRNGLGIAIHVAVSSISNGALQARTVFAPVFDSLETEAGQVDLLIDFGYLHTVIDEVSLRWIRHRLIDGVSWRSIIIAGTSVPESLSIEVGRNDIQTIGRREPRLASDAARIFGRTVRAGDFGVQNPLPPTPGPVPQMVASVRYSFGPQLRMARAKEPLAGRSKPDKQGDYARLARTTVVDNRFRPDCCWGCHELDAIAAGKRLVAAQASMRAIATCHHLTENAPLASTGPSARSPRPRPSDQATSPLFG